MPDRIPLEKTLLACCGKPKDGTEPAAPAAASTVILVRESVAGPCEVYLMRRHRRQAFMGGAFVFPGGRVEVSDRAPEALSFLDTGVVPPRRRLQDEGLAEEEAAGFFLAGIRETFEEAGILFADSSGERSGEDLPPDTEARLRPYRAQLQAGTLTMAEMARRERLRYRADLLIPFARWITPEILPVRFDTFFFLARVAEKRIAFPDERELTEGRWLAAGAALEEHAAGRIVLMPPTLKTIEELAAHPDASSLCAAAAAREIHPVLPEAFADERGMGVLFPQDPEYRGKGARSPAPGETTRVVLIDGIWRTAAV